MKISEKTKDTPISMTLKGKAVDIADVQPWFRVNTFSPGLRHSPHYNFHGAFAQAHKMELVCELIQAGPEEKRRIAENILRLWQTEKRYLPVEHYLQTEMEQGMKKTGQDIPLEVEEKQ
ncbi:MAG: hypothetical protein A2Z25_05105 [Planctomycetes bacterium RBG_16_55_9]|nr:MAG: hypothetical protein A2Z25_05105 [Planctomycetes bacterium RBG_16_55_9]